MYSQNNEEQVIAEIFGDYVGNFLDIGACDGRLNSNTLALVEKGWSGMLVEPSPRAFIKLQELHGSNPKLLLVHAAITAYGGSVRFWDSPSALGYSTTEEENRRKWNHLCAFDRCFLTSTMPIIGLVNRMMFCPDREIMFQTIDLLGIDTEGTSVELLKVFPFDMVRPRVVCVEHDGFIDECQGVASKYGYHEVSRNAENLIYVRD